eukprot:CAMPEP_0184403230 /NCGR_PEP_ID=MMETSP0007-20130409/85301_1 /TAXON_ID=97485 /ORGANISM="Prymnesium parvum, Strain Texoma1" /LENGTH=254 /DNA_ID=CAMNT_0026759319 /DNA_START=487 /DNA_END=1253 /DNA_ORIENTATION=-
MASIDRLRGGRRGGDRRDGHNRPDDMNHADRSRDHDGRSRPGGSHHADRGHGDRSHVPRAGPRRNDRPVAAAAIAAATWPSALVAWSGYVDGDVTAVVVTSMHRIRGIARIPRVFERHEAEPAQLPCLLVRGKVDVFNVAKLAEIFADLLLVRLERQSAHKDLAALSVITSVTHFGGTLGEALGAARREAAATWPSALVAWSGYVDGDVTAVVVTSAEHTLNRNARSPCLRVREGYFVGLFHLALLLSDLRALH